MRGPYPDDMVEPDEEDDPEDFCACGHLRRQHLNGEGPCRWCRCQRHVDQPPSDADDE